MSIQRGFSRLVSPLFFARDHFTIRNGERFLDFARNDKKRYVRALLVAESSDCAQSYLINLIAMG